MSRVHNPAVLFTETGTFKTSFASSENNPPQSSFPVGLAITSYLGSCLEMLSITEHKKSIFKLERARFDASRPLHITDTEFALMMLRESYIAAQASSTLPFLPLPVYLSTALTTIFL
jgi:hypothetical protein